MCAVEIPLRLDYGSGITNGNLSRVCVVEGALSLDSW